MALVNRTNAHPAMPLLIVRDSLGIGGAETMLASVVNRLDQARFHTTVLSLHTCNPMAAAIRQGAADLIEVPRKWRYDLSPALKIRRIVQSLAIREVLCFGFYEFFFTRVAMLGMRVRPRIAVSIHSMARRAVKSSLQSRLYAGMLTGEENLISVCDAQADDWSAAYRIPRRSFTTIYNGVDTEFFSPDSMEKAGLSTRRQLGIPEGAFVIVMVARFHQFKQHEVALRALRLLLSRSKEDDPPAYLLLVGNGSPERETSLRRMVADLEIRERVVFCGSQSDVRPFLSAANLFTLTSSSESFPVSSLEAMSMGLPVVLTDVGGAGEQTVDGLSGLLVPPGDESRVAAAWGRVRQNRDVFDRRAIREFVIRRFAVDTCVRQYEAILAAGHLT